MKIFRFIDTTLKSVKFSVFLMLMIGVASIYGTIYPAKTPFDFNLYKTPYYVSLLFLFAVNIGYCTIFRLFRQTKIRLGEIKGGRELVRFSGDTADVLQIFKKNGFKIEEKDSCLYLYKGKSKIVIVLIIHVAITLLILSAGLSSLTGFLGTANVHVNDKLSQCFDWNKKQDVKLSFDIVVDSAKIEFYPMDIKVLAEDMISGKTELFTTKEGASISFAGKTFKFSEADILTGRLKVDYLKKGNEWRSFDNIVLDGNLKIKFTLKAYIDPIPKQYLADIAIFENKVQKASKVISINDPLYYNGYRIYLLNIDKDNYGFDYVGVQITKEPFILFIWIFSIMLCISLIFYPFIKEYRYRISKEGAVFVLFALPPLLNSEMFFDKIKDKIKLNQ